MKVLDILSDLLSKASDYGKDHAEELLAGGAIVASVTGVALAIKTTNDIHDDVCEVTDAIEETKDAYDPVNQEYETDVLDSKGENNIVLYGQQAKKQYKTDLVDLRVEKAKIFIKAYWKVAALEFLSAGLTIAGDRVGRKHQEEWQSRYLETSAKLATTIGAISSIQSSYDQYRANVKERFGEEADHDIMQGITRTVEKAKVKDPETGKTKTVEVVTENRNKDKAASRWTRCFDEASKNWKKDAFCNVDFLRSAQSMFNVKLRCNGYVTVNEIYDWLDVPKCPDGQTWGWIYDPDYECQINFGLMDIYDPAKRDFINGYERNVWIEFGKEPYFIADKAWGVGDFDYSSIANRRFVGRGMH